MSKKQCPVCKGNGVIPVKLAAGAKARCSACGGNGYILPTNNPKTKELMSDEAIDVIIALLSGEQVLWRGGKYRLKPVANQAKYATRLEALIEGLKVPFHLPLSYSVTVTEFMDKIKAQAAKLKKDM